MSEHIELPEQMRLHCDQRIYRAVKKLGYTNVSKFANTRPTVKLSALVRELGLQAFMVSRLEALLIKEARADRATERCARGLFVRVLNDVLPNGWEARAPHAFVTTMISITMTYLLEYPDRLDDAINGIRERLRTPIPVGWLPQSADDPIVVMLLNNCWSVPVITNTRWTTE